jgi:Ni/Co efflux regulator RcnB
MSTRKLFAIAVAGLALAASPAFAGDGKHKGYKGHKTGDKVYVIDGNGHHDNGLHKGWYKQAWRRGDRIPLAYVEPVYIVDDYRAYHLSAPPVGYRWVRPMDDRYLLVDLATGLVAEALGY